MPDRAASTATARRLVSLPRLGDVDVALDGTVAYVRTVADLAADCNRSELWLLPAEGVPRQVAAAGDAVAAARFSPDGRWLAALVRRGEAAALRVLDREGGTVAETVIAAKASPPRWAPDGARLAMVAGDPGRVVVATLEGESLRAQPLDAPPGEAFGAAWRPDGSSITLAVSPAGRPPTRADLLDLRPGARPVPLRADLAFCAAPVWAPGGDRLAVAGSRDERLGLEDPALAAFLLAGGAEATGVELTGTVGVVARPGCAPVFTPAGDLWLVVASAGASRLVCLAADGEMAAIDLDRHVGALAAHPRGGVVCAASRWDVPAELLRVERAAAGAERMLATSGWPEPGVPETRHRRFVVACGEQRDGWVLGRRKDGPPQPLLVSVHGGPHSQAGPGFPHGHLYRLLLAARGWLVLTLNPTGSGSYGAAFADAIRSAWGVGDLPEQLAAVDALIADGSADPGRIAIAGYSYGGYLAAWAASRCDRFRAAVVGAPITDLASFHATSDIGEWFTSWEMGGPPQALPERYRELSPVWHADRVRIPMLLLHGEEDVRCPISQSEQLLTALQAAGRRDAELVRYPGASHLFYHSGRPSHRLDFNERIVRWLEREVAGSRVND